MPLGFFSPLGKLARPTRLFLIVFFALFNLCAALRAADVNTFLLENEEHVMGDVDRRITRVFDIAQDQADKPFFRAPDHALFFLRNPAMFKGVAELFVRAGATTPTPIRAFCLLLYDAGLLFCFLWLLALFESELVASVGLGFLLTTTFMVYDTTSIHAGPYVFCFVFGALYSFARYLRSEGDRRWLGWVAAFYFLACLNYWMMYVPTYLVLLAMLLREGRLTWRWALGLGAIPTCAFLFVLLQIVAARGVAAGTHGLFEMLAARTVDARIPGSTWYPNTTFLTPYHVRNYPRTVLARVEDSMGTSLPVLLALAAGPLVISGRRHWREHRWIGLLVLAALSWNLVMVQHTVKHRFVGFYGFAAWTAVVAAFTHAAVRAARPSPRLVAAVLVPLAVLKLDLFAQRTYQYASNVIAGKRVRCSIEGNGRCPKPGKKASAKREQSCQRQCSEAEKQQRSWESREKRRVKEERQRERD